MKNLLWFAQWWTSYYSCGNPPLCPLDCQSLIFSRFWPWPNASQTHRHPKGGKNLRKCGTKTDTYDPLAMYYGNRKGAGNPKFVPHRSVRWWAVNYRWPWFQLKWTRPERINRRKVNSFIDLQNFRFRSSLYKNAPFSHVLPYLQGVRN
jgi:hypothetical protein